MLIGQPNVGKSTLFNILSRAHVRVSNWPGTTVEVKRSYITYRNYTIELIDLPGTYSLTPTSTEEKVTRTAILTEEADVYLVLVDSTTIERSLLLALEVLEMCTNVIIVLTKYDMLHKLGIHINLTGLERKLHTPIVPVSAHTKEGIQRLLDTIVEVYEKGRQEYRFRLSYGKLDRYIEQVEKILSDRNVKIGKICPRWIALKLLERDYDIIELVREIAGEEICKQIEKIYEEAVKDVGKNIEEYVLEVRRDFVRNLTRECVVRVEIRHSKLVENIDKIFMHPVLGGILSIIVLSAAVFSAFMINMGFPLNVILALLGHETAARIFEEYSLSGLLDKAFTLLANYVYYSLKSFSVPLAQLLAYGIIGSVGAVLSFLPLIFLVSIILAVIEDSGLGARMAVALHTLFSKIGLSGRAVYPTLVAFGCNVPAVLATRIAITQEERTPLALAVTFIPCQARLVVLMFIAGALAPPDPVSKTMVVVGTLLTTMIIYCLTARLVSRLVTKTESSELVLEIPPLHSPNLRVVWWISWDIVKHFLIRAGTIILASSIALWALLHYGPAGYVTSVEESFAAALGHAVAPLVTAVLGISRIIAWKVGLALLYGLVAKENIVATLVSTGLGLERLTLGQAMAFAILTLTYVPCLPTMVTLFKELRNAKLVLSHVVYMCVIGTVAAAIARVILQMM